MSELKKNLVDVSRLYTLKKYAEIFQVSYNSVYGRYLNSLVGKSRNPFHLITVNGCDLIFVSEENEKELLSKIKPKGKKQPQLA